MCGWEMTKLMALARRGEIILLIVGSSLVALGLQAQQSS